jgi:hypothetical protein
VPAGFGEGDPHETQREGNEEDGDQDDRREAEACEGWRTSTAPQRSPTGGTGLREAGDRALAVGAVPSAEWSRAKLRREPATRGPSLFGSRSDANPAASDVVGRVAAWPSASPAR